MLPLDNYFHNTNQVLSGEMGEEMARNLFKQFNIKFFDWTKVRDRVDFDVHVNSKKLRVQVKNTLTGSWVVEGGRAGDYHSYTKKDVDVMLLTYYQEFWTVPAEIWEQKAKRFHNMTVEQCKSLFPEYHNNLSFYGCSDAKPVEDNLLHLFNG